MSVTDPGAVRAQAPFAAVLASTATLALGVACSAPPPRPLDLDRVAAEVAVRDAEPAELERALALAELAGLGLERPSLEATGTTGATGAADAAPLWHASALAFNGALRDARRRFAPALARASSADAPDSMRLMLEERGFDAEDRELNVALTFDVLGLFGTGRAAAAGALADAEARNAWADVEREAWSARCSVDGARVQLAASRARMQGLAELLAEVAPSLRRAELLYELDRLSEGEIERLRATALEVEHVLHVEQATAARLRRGLADAAGLPASASALDEVTPRTLEVLFAHAREPAAARGAEVARVLLERNPDARRARLGYALAEARLRDEVARTRPDVRLGPRAVFRPDDVLPGGVLVLELPHGRALRGRIEAADVGRERAREALEEVLRAALARLDEARTRYRAAREALELHALPREAATARALAAARARFDVDPRGVEAFGMALQERTRSLLGALDVRLNVVLAGIDGELALGPEPRSSEAEEPLTAEAR